MPDWIYDLEAQRDRLVDQFTKRAGIVWKMSGLAETIKTEETSTTDNDGDVNMSGEDGTGFQGNHALC